MPKRSSRLLSWILLGTLAIGQIALLVALISNNLTYLDIAGWFFGAIVPGLMLLYEWLKSNNLRFFLWSNRIRSRFSRFSPSWGLAALMEGPDITEETLDEVIERLKSLGNDAKKVVVREAKEGARFVDLIPGPQLEISFARARPGPMLELDDNELPSIRLAVRNYNVGFAQAERVIRRDISPLLELFADVVPHSQSKYKLTIRYEKGENPFYGLYIAQLPEEAISEFAIRLIVDDYGPSNTVTISESQLAINTNRQWALRDLALDFLSFDPGLRERLISG